MDFSTDAIVLKYDGTRFTVSFPGKCPESALVKHVGFNWHKKDGLWFNPRPEIAWKLVQTGLAKVSPEAQAVLDLAPRPTDLPAAQDILTAASAAANTPRQPKEKGEKTSPKSAYERFTEQFVKAMTEAKAPTEWPWIRNSGAFGAPINALTGKKYKGVNRFFLSFKSEGCREWANYNQWVEKGCRVKEGERGSVVVYMGESYVDANDQFVDKDTPGARKIVWPKTSTVFNGLQVDGYKPRVELPLSKVERDAAVDEFLKGTGAKIEIKGETACFRPLSDSITLPDQRLFKDTESGTATEHFYSVAFHELAHWTGAKSRLNRPQSTDMDSQEYAFEELVAEISAAFTASDLGVKAQPSQQNMNYVRHWLEACGNDPKFIVDAARKAEAATSYLHDLQPKRAQEADQEQAQLQDADVDAALTAPTPELVSEKPCVITLRDDVRFDISRLQADASAAMSMLQSITPASSVALEMVTPDERENMRQALEKLLKNDQSNHGLGLGPALTALEQQTRLTDEVALADPVDALEALADRDLRFRGAAAASLRLQGIELLAKGDAARAENSLLSAARAEAALTLAVVEKLHHANIHTLKNFEVTALVQEAGKNAFETGKAVTEAFKGNVRVTGGRDDDAVAKVIQAYSVKPSEVIEVVKSNAVGRLGELDGARAAKDAQIALRVEQATSEKDAWAAVSDYCREMGSLDIAKPVLSALAPEPAERDFTEAVAELTERLADDRERQQALGRAAA